MHRHLFDSLECQKPVVACLCPQQGYVRAKIYAGVRGRSGSSWFGSWIVLKLFFGAEISRVVGSKRIVFHDCLQGSWTKLGAAVVSIFPVNSYLNSCT